MRTDFTLKEVAQIIAGIFVGILALGGQVWVLESLMHLAKENGYSGLHTTLGLSSIYLVIGEVVLLVSVLLTKLNLIKGD